MLTFQLSPPARPRLRRLLLPAGMFAVFGALFVSRFTTALWALGATAVAIPLAMLVYVLLRHRARAKQPRLVQLDERALTLPGPRGPLTLPLESLRSVLMRGQPTVQGLVIEADRQDFWLDRKSFLPPESFDELLSKLNAQIRALPDGEARHEAMAERARVSNETFSRPANVTRVILGLLIAIFALEYQMGALDKPFALVGLGANAPVLIFEHGQWFRLISGNFLHANLLHIGLNGLAILNLGTAIERMVGSARLLLVYMSAAIGGAIVSALAGAGSHSVGASTAVFGLLGAFGLITWRFSDRMPVGLRQTRVWWIQVLGLNAALPLMIPQIDGGAHAGGFFAGVLFAALAVPKKARLPIRTTRGAPLAIALTIALCGFGLVGTLLRYPQARADISLVIEAHLKNEKDPLTLNFFAWETAIDPAADPEALGRAKAAAQRARDLSKGGLEMTDTLATIHFRLAQFPEAIDLEENVLRRANDGYQQVYASQLGRFILAQNKTPNGVTLNLSQSTNAEISIEVQAPQADAARTVYAVITQKRKPIGLAVLPIPAGHDRAVHSFEVAPLQAAKRANRWPSDWPPREKIALPAAHLVTGALSAEIWAFDQEVHGWP